MIIDTHTHLYVEEFNEDRNEMISRATAAGIQKFLLPNIDSTSIESMLEMEKNFPNQAYPMMGLHPCSVKSNYIEELNIVESYLADRDFIGIGEIGLDMYWDQSTIEIQKEVFVKHLQWA
ncbi:MAG: TatD family hydrolase, partial [Saprospiraceae bacterium]